MTVNEALKVLIDAIEEDEYLWEADFDLLAHLFPAYVAVLAGRNRWWPSMVLLPFVAFDDDWPTDAVDEEHWPRKVAQS